MLVGEFDKITDEVTALAKAPQKMMATLNGMIKNAKPDALRVAEGMFDDLKTDMVASLGLSGIVDGFDDLKGWMNTIQDGLDSIGAGLPMPICIKSILSNPLIEAAIGADLASMSGVSDISKITGRLKALVIGQLQANAMAFLDRGMAKMGIGGIIAGAEMGYKKMLKSSGILDGIDLMSDIADCLALGCGDADGYSLKIEDMMSGMNMTIDQDVMPLWTDQTDPMIKAAIADTVAQGNAIADEITMWNGTLDFSS
jgi:hypothetical protein